MSVELSSQAPIGGRAAYQPLVLLLAALAAGMVADRLMPLAGGVWWLIASGLLVGWCVVWKRGRDGWASAVLLVAIGAVAGGWHHDRWNLFGEDDVGRMLTERIQPMALEGIAWQSPRWSPAPPGTALRTIPKGEESELLLRVTRVRDGQTWRPASGWAFMDVDGHLLGVHAGDELRIMALASRPMQPLNPGEFSYADYERSRRVFCRLRGLFPESIEVIRPSGWSLQRVISDVRLRGDSLLRRNIGPERATLASAILIGAREQLDPDRNEGFLVTGTIHVLSISGLHVGILALAFWWMFRTGLVPRAPALIGAMLFTIGYALLTDAQPPVVRATILVCVMCLARLTYRRALSFNTLAFAGIVVLVLQPSSLFQAGPQLSFLSVAAMIVASPLLNPARNYDPLDHLIATTRPWPVRFAKQFGSGIWRIWLTGAVVWTATLPLVWLNYHLISPVALLLNLLMWLPIFVAMLAGFGTLLFGLLIPPLGRWCGATCDGSLNMIEQLIAGGRGVWGSYFWLPAPPAWWVAVFYVGLAAICVVPRFRLPTRWLFALATAWLAIAVVLANRPWLRAADDEPTATVTFVAVGHGTAVLVESGDRALLYDAGHLGSPLGAVRPVSEVLWSRGLSHIDAVVISHADSDHFNGLPELLRRFSVGAVYVSPVMSEATQPAVLELREALRQSELPVQTLSGGDRLKLGSATAEVLHPPRRGVIGSDNANSIVLAIEVAGRRLLLPGDLESPGLDDLLAEEPLRCDIVMAPHHGSRRSDPVGFALWTQPAFTVLSGSRNTEDEREIVAVEQSYIARGATVFHTQIDGGVRFEMTADGVTAAAWRHGGW